MLHVQECHARGQFIAWLVQRSFTTATIATNKLASLYGTCSTSLSNAYAQQRTSQKRTSQKRHDMVLTDTRGSKPVDSRLWIGALIYWSLHGSTEAHRIRTSWTLTCTHVHVRSRRHRYSSCCCLTSLYHGDRVCNKAAIVITNQFRAIDNRLAPDDKVTSNRRVTSQWQLRSTIDWRGAVMNEVTCGVAFSATGLLNWNCAQNTQQTITNQPIIDVMKNGRQSKTHRALVTRYCVVWTRSDLKWHTCSAAPQVQTAKWCWNLMFIVYQLMSSQLNKSIVNNLRYLYTFLIFWYVRMHTS